ncbi:MULTISPECIES: hypothetical protein [Streptomyces]|uniref:hypothetical protein n=1 Tax=Streptomyces TaxID=1883 RepID=UPI00163CBFDE|nr:MULTISPECIES: hypothetical protein [Streptomyces]MBC2876712.1 hypothetical protein [Streptomyces sp. TYQ1024]UBI36340.1 hypothetical protein K7I03_07595 [Streptomyces mobaraensis]UKW28934.1 hypothetical protein MCU78_07580 [Streptomyces sp. TYQ1024]
MTHTGPGDIHVHVGDQLRDSDKPAFRRVAEDQLRWLRRVLVAPFGMGTARAVLDDTGTVILDGEPGSGRTSAARVLLREYHRDGGDFHELLPDEEEDELSLHDPALVGTGDQLLLDLSAADDRQWSAVRTDLSALRKTVHERHAHLVIVMPHGGTLDPDLQYYRVEIKRPIGSYVLKRHLRMHGVPPEQYLRIDTDDTGFLLDERPMREIAGFADLIRRARESARPGEGFAEWCATAKSAWTGRRKEIAALVAGLREAPQRALLLTVSMLHGAHADVIHHATRLLLRALDTPSEEIPLIQHRDLAERLAEIAAETGPGGHVRFTELDYDSAVRAHFWDHMPDVRPHLGAWAANVVEMNEPHAGLAVRDGLVARLAGQYLRTGRGDGLASVAEQWSSGTPGKARLEAAVHALTCALNDPDHGREFRERIYQWCAHRRLRGEFAQVLVRICADVLATSHPDQALLRLYYLARRERGTTSALRALGDLAAGSRRLDRRLLDRLARSDLSPPDLGIFLRTCDPARLTDSSDTPRALVEEIGVQRSLTTCWHAVLAGLPRTTWQPHAEHWLLQAAEDTGHRGELLLDLVVSAADRCGERRGEVFAALYASARAAERLSPGDPTRSVETTELLLDKIGVVQGVGGPATPSPA